MEYQCGLTMVGAIDTQTHGDNIEIISECFTYEKNTKTNRIS
jgi:hypothetical protein